MTELLLQRLREYNKRFAADPAMYVSTPIRWLIELDEGGSLKGFVQMQGEGRRGKRGKEFLAPHAGRAFNIVAKLLADRADYVLGVTVGEADASRRQRTSEAHRAFVALVGECAAVTDEPAVLAVLRFLGSLDLASLDVPPDLAPGDNITFRVGNVLPIELSAVARFWADRNKEDVIRAAGGIESECLVCGRRRPPATRHRIKIKRIPGGQPSGMTLVSANAPAFESYGLRASLIAPICAECAEDYAKAATRLIDDDRTHLIIGNLMYLFWTLDASMPQFASLLRDPQPDDVKELLRAPQTGRKEATKVEVAPFYAAALAASGGRVAVREWLETTVTDAKRHLWGYFQLQSIVEGDGSKGHPIGLFPLAASLVARPKDLPSQIPASLLRLALGGTPLPSSLLSAAIQRTRAEQRVTRPRAAVIKMVLFSGHPKEAESMEQLNLGLRHPAYLCGRVFALVEAIQRAALGDVKATVGDRYFGAASSSPAYVLGKLVSDAKKAHFGKLRRENPGAYYSLNQRLEEALEGLVTFPATLTLEDQGRFVLGYFHQRAADRAGARARRAERGLAEGDQSETTREGER